MISSPLTNSSPLTVAKYWQLRDTRLTFDRLPVLMGIVNVTPDSFSDGGQNFEPRMAVDRALKLAADGAGILDIGGESTRPYSTPVDEIEERRRIEPVVRAVCAQTTVPVSIDTSKASVALAALDAGAQIINDITGLTGDPDMIAVAVRSQAGVCAMHMQGTPQTMQDDPTYANLLVEIGSYLRHRRDDLIAAGIDPQRICLDPGIGFGKTHQHNVTLMANCWRFHELGCPLLVGHSRKGFMGKLIGDKQADRDFATIGAACVLARQSIQVIRVHNIRAAREAILLFTACGGVDGQEHLF